LLSACGGSDGGDSPTTAPSVPDVPKDVPTDVPKTPESPEPSSCASGVIIRFNEAVASNSVHQDRDGDTPDWFELYSCKTTATSLFGWTLTDNVEKPEKWTFPEYVMQPDSYLKIWASNKDKFDLNFHTNFKISSAGETLYLYDDLGVLIDSLVVENLPPDHSVGISTTDEQRVFFSTPTPGSENSSPSNTGSVANLVAFSHSGGTTAPLSLLLSGANENQVIRYTTDASEPNESSTIYSDALAINNTTVVRARIFQQDYIPSAIFTRTYLLNITHDLPIVTLVTEPDNFFNQQSGIYTFGLSDDWQFPFFSANFWWDSEKPINVSLYEDNGNLGVNFDAGAKIFGGWSRAYDQRSLSIFVRGQYGLSKLSYPLFPQLPYDKFQSFVLRNSGQDWSRTMFRDGLMTTLMQGSAVDSQAYRPVVTYINGEYYGIYNLREKINEHFIASKHDLDKDDIDIVEKDGELIYGNTQDYHDLVNYVQSHNLTADSAYNSVANRIDINNYISYQLAQIYFNNTDWPGNNIKYWKATEGKWRWILFDTDFGFNIGIGGSDEFFNNTLAFALDDNGPGWPNPPWSTLLLRKLLENNIFKQQFVNTFADEINSRFLPTKVLNHIDTLAEVISLEIPSHRARWQSGYDFQFNWPAQATWFHEVELMRTFARQRPAQVLNHLNEQFNLAGFYPITITLDNTEQGEVLLNSLTITEASWQGRYFNGVPITLTALPKPGYVFSHWQGASTATTAKITMSLTAATVISPIFVAQ